MDGDYRLCSLSEDGQLKELIVSVDDERRRLAYSIQESPFNFAYHISSMQVTPGEGKGARLVWITDVKPDGVVPDLEQAIDAAASSLQQALR